MFYQKEFKNIIIRMSFIFIAFIAFITLIFLFGDLSLLKGLQVYKNVFFILLAFLISLLTIYLKAVCNLFLTILENFTISKKTSYHIILSNYSLKNITNLFFPISSDVNKKFVKNNVSERKIAIYNSLKIILFFYTINTISLFLFLIQYNFLKQLLGYNYFFILIFIVLNNLFFISFLLLKYFKLPKFKKISDNIKVSFDSVVYKKFFLFSLITVLNFICFLVPGFIMPLMLKAFKITIYANDFIKIFFISVLIYLPFNSNHFLYFIPLPDILTYIFLQNMQIDNLTNKIIITIILFYRFITTLAFIATGEFFNLLVKISENIKISTFQKRLVDIIEKRNLNRSYNILYLSDCLDTTKFLKLFSFFKNYNINILILAAKTIKNLRLPQNNKFTLTIVNKINLKQKINELIENNTFEFFVTDTTEYFGLNCKKLATRLTAPFIYIPQDNIVKKEQSDIFKLEANLTFESNIKNNFLNKNDKIIDIDYIVNLDTKTLTTMIIEKLNIFSIQKLDKLSKIKILLLSNNPRLEECLKKYLLNLGYSLIIFNKTKMISVQKSKKLKYFQGSFYSHKDIYNLFRHNSFNFVIDLLDNTESENTKEQYNLFMNMMIVNNVNYFLKLNTQNQSSNYLPKIDPIINKAKELNILNIVTIKFPNICFKISDIIKEKDNITKEEFLEIIKLGINQVLDKKGKSLKIINKEEFFKNKKIDNHKNYDLSNYYINYSIYDLSKE